jgi:hypothetical protein
VVAQGGGDQRHVARANGVDEAAVAAHHIRQLTAPELDRGPHQRAHLAVELVPELGQPGPAARRDEQAVQARVALDGLGQVARRDGLGHRVEFAPERRDQVVVDDRALLGDRAGLEEVAGEAGVLDLGPRHAGHPAAAARRELDQPVVLELHQRRPQRRPADAELGREARLDEPLARGELVVEYSPPKREPNGLRQRKVRDHDDSRMSVSIGRLVAVAQ